MIRTWLVKFAMMQMIPDCRHSMFRTTRRFITAKSRYRSASSHALVNSKVFRDLGGTILTTPEVTTGVFDPAITYTDPLFSEEAALSAFDANVSAAAFFQNNDQPSNLTFQGNNGIFVQDFHDYRFELQKLSATGSLFTLRNLTNYDNSNQTGQTLPHAWSTVFEGEVRQPLLQGAGVLFNRIAGPSRQPGVYGGVLIARTNTEITLSRFEEGVRDLISEVENAYWDLYFSYRNLAAVIEGRDKAHEILLATTEGQSSRRQPGSSSGQGAISAFRI